MWSLQVTLRNDFVTFWTHLLPVSYGWRRRTKINHIMWKECLLRISILRPYNKGRRVCLRSLIIYYIIKLYSSFDKTTAIKVSYKLSICWCSINLRIRSWIIYDLTLINLLFDSVDMFPAWLHSHVQCTHIQYSTHVLPRNIHHGTRACLFVCLMFSLLTVYLFLHALVIILEILSGWTSFRWTFAAVSCFVFMRSRRK